MPISIIKGSEPYFNDPQGFKRYGIFIPILQHLVDAINDRALEKLNLFETDMTNLLATLKTKPEAYHALLQLFDHLRAKGLVIMVKHKSNFLQYHVAAHSAEAAHDTGRVLAAEYTASYPNDTFANNFYIALAKAAAAWHDVVQFKTPPHNEKDSGIAFTNECKKQLLAYSEQFPELKEPITKFINHLTFISNELIVYDTWLVFGNDTTIGMHAKTLRVYIENVMNDLQLPVNYGSHMQHLLIAAKTISLSDVSRFSLSHVQSDQQMLKAFEQLPNELKTPLNNFFDYCNITSDAAKEAFLGIFSSNIRMYSELNIPADGIEPQKMPFNAAHVTTHDYEEFTNALETLRNAPEPKIIRMDYIKLFDLLMNTKCVTKNTSYMEREKNFALAQKIETWDTFASQLEGFKLYTDNLDRDQLRLLSQCLFILATKYQPGIEYLENDKTFQELQIKLSNPDTWAIDTNS